MVFGFHNHPCPKYGAFGESYPTFTHWDRLCGLDGHWSCGHRVNGYFGLQGTGIPASYIFPNYFNRFYYWPKSGFSLMNEKG